MNKRKIDYVGYLYIAPALAFFVLFMAYPMLFVVRTSFFEWDGFSAQKIFVGLNNYIQIYKRGYLLTALRNFAVFFIFTVPLQMLLGMIFASMLTKRTLLYKIAKSIFFIPVIMTPIIIGYVFSNILEMNFGLLNVTLRNIGLGFLAQNWTGSPGTAMFTIIAVSVWQGMGFSLVMYIAGIVAIPTEVNDACNVDGANAFVQFWRITFPLLRSTHATLLILGAIGSLKVFDIIWVLTGGGPGTATASFSTLILKESFDAYKQGTSSALSVVLIICAVIITWIQLRFIKTEH